MRSHDDFQTEWWYYTGNLTAKTGEHFGYQLTFFRRALAPPDQRTSRDSAWAADQVYMAHLALTDVSSGKHYAFEKLARGAAGLAGAQAEPFRVWLEDWSVVGPSAGQARLRASVKDVASNLNLSLDLNLADLKGPILQGDQGYSRKGPEPGNASYYVSLPRMATTGTVTIGGNAFTVNGLSWMDHEWSTSALGAGQAGWDWFSIQLDDNTELMLFQLRRADGSADGFSSGTLIAADGSTRSLGPGDFSIEVTDHWRSPRTGAAYPAGSAADPHAVAGRPGDGCIILLLGGRGEGGGDARPEADRGQRLRGADGVRAEHAAAVLISVADLTPLPFRLQ